MTWAAAAPTNARPRTSPPRSLLMRLYYDRGPAAKRENMSSEAKQMSNVASDSAAPGLGEHGIHNLNAAWSNLKAPQLIEHAVQRREGTLAQNGALVVRTGQFTGRSPKDKFIVREETTDSTVQWGAVNQPMSEAHFDRIYARAANFWSGQDAYVQDLLVGADPEFAMPVRVVSQLAWHSLFGRQLFIRPDTSQRRQPEFTILFAPEFQANPADEGTNSETCIVINFKKRVVLILGTSYAGEMKKSA